MPINPRTKVTLCRIVAILFAIAGVSAIVAAYGASQESKHLTPYIGQAVLYFGVGFLFFMVAHIKRKAIQSEQGDSSRKSQ